MAKEPRAIGIELIQDISNLSSPTDGFLRRHRHRAKTVLEGGKRTDTYIADFIDREVGRRDAVVVAIYAKVPSGTDILRTPILLRRQVRYAMFVVDRKPLCTEVVAGLIEKDDTPETATLRETLEEANLEITADQITRLGQPIYVLPGTLTERIFPIAVVVEEAALRSAIEQPIAGDGHELEQGAELLLTTLGEALRWMELPLDRETESVFPISDAKTELVLLRLKDRLVAEDSK